MADDKHTLRMGDLDKESLRVMADDLDVSLSEIFRGQAENLLRLYQESDIDNPIEIMDAHSDNLIEDEDYRELHVKFYQDERDFESFVKEEYYFETKWVDETAVDYDMMLEEFESVVSDAQRGKVDDDYFDEAYDTIDELRDQGYEREAFLLNTVVEKFQE